MSKTQAKPRRICVYLPEHQVAWAQSQPKASPAVAAAIQFYLDSIKPKRVKRAAVPKPI